METKHHLEQNLRQLRLPGILENLSLRLKEAEDNRLGYFEFLSLMIQDEMDNRNANVFAKNLKAARFGQEKTFENFDFNFNHDELPPEKIRDLASCRFIDMREPVIISGPPGIGKSHISKALGHEAVRRRHTVIFAKFCQLMRLFIDAELNGQLRRELKRYCKPDLLILDDFALRKLSVKEAEFFYELVDERLTGGSIIVTSNRPPQDWGGVFPDPVVGGAILDRIASHAHKIVTTKARSYRKEKMSVPEEAMS